MFLFADEIFEKTEEDIWAYTFFYLLQTVIQNEKKKKTQRLNNFVQGDHQEPDIF